MSLKKTVETLTHTAVSTAVTAARHPIGTATRATGLVKDTAGLGLGLVRERIGGTSTPTAEKVPAVGEKPVAEKPTAKKAPEKKAEQKKAAAPAEDPRDDIPGPDLAAFAPPAPEDLPEPIVIEAE